MHWFYGQADLYSEPALTLPYASEQGELQWIVECTGIVDQLVDDAWEMAFKPLFMIWWKEASFKMFILCDPISMKFLRRQSCIDKEMSSYQGRGTGRGSRDREVSHARS